MINLTEKELKAIRLKITKLENKVSDLSAILTKAPLLFTHSDRSRLRSTEIKLYIYESFLVNYLNSKNPSL